MKHKAPTEPAGRPWLDDVVSSSRGPVGHRLRMMPLSSSEARKAVDRMRKQLGIAAACVSGEFEAMKSPKREGK